MLFTMSRKRHGLICVATLLWVTVLHLLGLHLPGMNDRSVSVSAAPPAAKKGPAAPEVKTLATFNRFPDWVAGVALHPTAPVVATGSYGVIQVYDYAAKKQIVSLEEKAGFVRSVAFSPDGKWLASGSYQSVTVWETATYRPLKTLPGHRGYVTALAFTPDQSRLITASDDETLMVWNTKDYESRNVLSAHQKPVSGLAISPDGKWFASCSGDTTRPSRFGEILLWAIDAEQPAQRFAAHDKAITALAISPDGKQLASASFDETIRVWQVNGLDAEPKAVMTLVGHSRPVNSVAFLPDREHLISGAGGRYTGMNTVGYWSVSRADSLAVLAEHQGPVNQIAVSADGKRIATASADKSCRILELETPVASAASEKTSQHQNGSATNLPQHVAAAGDRLPSKDRLATRTSNSTAIVATGSASSGSSRGSSPGTGAKDDLQATSTPAKERTSQLKSADVTVLAQADKKADDKAAEEKKADEAPVKMLRAGMIGLDTSHCLAFTQALNDPAVKAELKGCRVIAAYPKGSPDIESSVSRVPKYTEEMQKMGVEIVDSIDALVSKVDVVFLETNDGRPHLEQVLPVLKAKKPVFIDKPIAGSLTDTLIIFRAAKHYGVPVFTSSSLRYSTATQALRNGKTNIGEIVGCDAYSPCHLEATHPDLYWYGIHGVETLFTVMGTGCESVTRLSTPGTDFAAGVWKGGRIGTFRGIRQGGSGYGGTAFGAKGIQAIGPYEGYRPLVIEIIKFFRTGEMPVPEAEMIEIYAFMEAADESKRQGGKPVTLESVLSKAKAEADKYELK